MQTGENTSQRITVVYIITGLHTGGAEIMLWNILSGIDKAHFNPVVISLIDGGAVADRIRQLGVQVYSMNMEPGKIPSPVILFKLVKLARSLRPGIIQGWMYHGNIAAQLTAFFLSRKIPVFWNIHHSVDSLSQEKSSTGKIIRIGAWMSKLPAGIIYVSETGRKQHELLGYNNKKSSVITNGVDVNLFVPSTDHGRSVRETLKLPAETFLIGMLARYHPMKDHENFLCAAALLQERAGDVHFILAGTNVNWENRLLKEMIERFKIRHISLLGEHADIRVLAAALNILTVSSSHGEASPVIMLEAMSCGVPCVATDVGDAAIIINGTGQVVPPRNPESLAGAWENLVKLDDAKREALGKAARERIMANYALQSIILKYEMLYRGILT